MTHNAEAWGYLTLVYGELMDRISFSNSAQFELIKDSNIIGRVKEKVDFEIGEGFISGEHLKISRDESTGIIHVQNLGANGTKIERADGTEIFLTKVKTPETNTTADLNFGDYISFNFRSVCKAKYQLMMPQQQTIQEKENVQEDGGSSSSLNNQQMDVADNDEVQDDQGGQEGEEEIPAVSIPIISNAITSPEASKNNDDKSEENNGIISNAITSPEASKNNDDKSEENNNDDSSPVIDKTKSPKTSAKSSPTKSSAALLGQNKSLRQSNLQLYEDMTKLKTEHAEVISKYRSDLTSTQKELKSVREELLVSTKVNKDLQENMNIYTQMVDQCGGPDEVQRIFQERESNQSLQSSLMADKDKQIRDLNQQLDVMHGAITEEQTRVNSMEKLLGQLSDVAEPLSSLLQHATSLSKKLKSGLKMEKNDNLESPTPSQVPAGLIEQAQTVLNAPLMIPNLSQTQQTTQYNNTQMNTQQSSRSSSGNKLKDSMVSNIDENGVNGTNSNDDGNSNNDSNGSIGMDVIPEEEEEIIPKSSDGNNDNDDIKSEDKIVKNFRRFQAQAAKATPNKKKISMSQDDYNMSLLTPAVADDKDHTTMVFSQPVTAMETTSRRNKRGSNALNSMIRQTTQAKKKSK